MGRAPDTNPGWARLLVPVGNRDKPTVYTDGPRLPPACTRSHGAYAHHRPDPGHAIKEHRDIHVPSVYPDSRSEDETCPDSGSRWYTTTENPSYLFSTLSCTNAMQSFISHLNQYSLVDPSWGNIPSWVWEGGSHWFKTLWRRVWHHRHFGSWISWK